MRRQVSTTVKPPMVREAQGPFWCILLIVTIASQFGLQSDIDAQNQTRSGMCTSYKNLYRLKCTTDSTMFTAGACAGNATGNATRDSLLSMVRTRASFNQTAGAFPPEYDVNNGSSNRGYGR
jgi:hypothetical protein